MAVLPEPRVVGRYQLYEAFAKGGMALVHLGRLRGPAGFSRTVAIKELHPSYSDDPAIVSTLLDEARLASRIRHPNVVSTLDVVVEGSEILLVLEYVHGESLARLVGDASPIPIDVVCSIVAGSLHGLHAAHEASAPSGEPLGIVHRDVSPQNILVGTDGLARVLDFGIAKARGRLQTTREGQVKGKLAYMAPEQVRSGEVTRRTDVFAAGIVLWEALTGARLFAGDNEGQVILKVLDAEVTPPSSIRSELPRELDAIVARALERDPDRRFETAERFALAIEALGRLAPASAVGRFVAGAAEDRLAERAARIARIEHPEAAPEAALGQPSPVSGAPTQTATIENVPAKLDLIAVEPSGESLGTDHRALTLDPSRARHPKRRRAALTATALAVALGSAAALSRRTNVGSTTTNAESSAASSAAAPAEPGQTAEVPLDVQATAPPSGSTAGNTAPAAATEATNTPPSAANQASRPRGAPRPTTAAKAASTASPGAPSAPPPASATKPFYRFE